MKARKITSILNVTKKDDELEIIFFAIAFLLRATT